MSKDWRQWIEDIKAGIDGLAADGYLDKPAEAMAEINLRGSVFSLEALLEIEIEDKKEEQ